MGIPEADVEVGEAAVGSAFGAGVGVVGLVGEDADCGGGDAVVGLEGPDVGEGVGEGSFDEWVFGGRDGLFVAAGVVRDLVISCLWCG